MEALGTAVGVASLGIQACQGLLTYYDGWKAYPSDINETYESIADLTRTLVLLKESLEGKELDQKRVDRVKRCLQSCEDALGKLSARAQKLQKHGQPEGTSQRTWSELQRLQYPFRARTLEKLRQTVSHVQGRLQIATGVLDLDVSQRSQTMLVTLNERTSQVEAHIHSMQQSDQFKKIIDWLSPPDPWTNHLSARQKCESQTGAWLLESDFYERWKAGLIKHIWLSGKPGCGKTVLCSTAIEDIKAHCAHCENTALAVFYFTFSDKRKQTYEDLFRSLVAQLGWKEPGLSMLQQAYDSSNRSVLGSDDLEKVLIASIKSRDVVFLMLDALDESPEESDARYDMLDRVEMLSQNVTNLKIFATSRDLRDVRESMATLDARFVSVATAAVDADIRRYIATQLSRDRRFARLDSKTTTLIKETISSKADGMFRWAYCQLLELKKLKMTGPKHIQDALHRLPATLDATYERMLTGIEPQYAAPAFTLLRWLAYAQSPPTLAELAEAVIVDPMAEKEVDTANRGGWEDTLDVLPGLVTVLADDDGNDDGDDDRDDDDYSDSSDSSQSGRTNISSGTMSIGVRDSHARSHSKIRLAHFSVQEYLKSSRILSGDAKKFHLNPIVEHEFLAQSCLAYLLHYSDSPAKTSAIQDLVTFPLLRYSAQSWFFHSSQQQRRDMSREISLLNSSDAKLDWLRVQNPEQVYQDPFEPPKDVGSSVYYASYLGLGKVVQMLLDGGADVNAQGGYYSNALQAASERGYEKIVRMLLDGGADVNALGGGYSNALYAASAEGHEKIVQMLLDGGADVNALGGGYSNALQAALERGYEKIVRMLLDGGPDVNALGGGYGNALYAASAEGHEKIVQMLLDGGADVNALGGGYGNALYAASAKGHDKIVRMLLDGGADANAQGGDYSNALQVASARGFDKIVRMLLDGGADVNAQGGRYYGNALQAASARGYDNIVRMLLDGGADVNAQGGYYSNALQAALERGYEKIVQMLLDGGADANAQGGY